MMGLFIPNMQKPKKGEVIAFDGEYAVYTDDDMQVHRYPLIEIDLVRCKECKRCEERTTLNGLSFLYCLKMEVSVGSDQYCYWGERRTDE